MRILGQEMRISSLTRRALWVTASGVFVYLAILAASEWTELAVADHALVLFTLGLFISTTLLWFASSDQVAAAHPPRLLVTQIDFDFRAWVRDGVVSDPKVFVFNAGASDAFFNAAKSGLKRHGNIRLYIGPHPPRAKPWGSDGTASPLPVEDEVFRAGQSKWWPIDARSYDNLSRESGAAILSGESADHLYIFGRIHFADGRDVDRQTIFCRRYDPCTDRFVPTNDPDYEYQT